MIDEPYNDSAIVAFIHTQILNLEKQEIPENWEESVRSQYAKYAKDVAQQLSTFYVETMSPEDQAIFRSIFDPKDSDALD